MNHTVSYSRFARWLRCVSLLVLLAYCAAVPAQNVLLPAYSASTGEKALQLVAKGSERNLCLVINPNSGPGSTRDGAFAALLTKCNARGVRVLFYIDLVAIPGDGLTPPSAKEHVKAPNELVTERMLYSRHYGSLKWDGWFFDDVRKGMNESFLCIANWPGMKVLNAGTKFEPPTSLASCTVVISEQANAWPRALTAWEQSHKSQCAVMGLKITADSLPAFMTSTRGMAFRYASPLDDQWRNGQSAYTSLTPYFAKLLP